MRLEPTADGFRLFAGDRVVIEHSVAKPCLFVGHGRERMQMYRGNFDIEDYIVERTPLAHAEIQGERILMSFWPGQKPRLILTVQDGDAAVRVLRPQPQPRLAPGRRRARSEHVWGGGEQMSYFDMRGRRFPFWTSEPGVGRDKDSEITFRADVSGQRGRRLLEHQLPPADLCVVRALCAACRDHRLQRVRLPQRRLPRGRDLGGAGEDRVLRRADLHRAVEKLSLRFGRQPRLPDWVYNGAIIGLKDGENSFAPARDDPRGGRAGLGPVVRGLGRPAQHLVRRAAVLGLAGQRDALSGPAPAHRRAATTRHPLPRLREPLSLRRRHLSSRRPRRRATSRSTTRGTPPSSTSASSTAASSTSPIPRRPTGSPSA